ncbi:4Fe-4S dicluster domain-containing protein [Solicola gregarius]|uniref:Polysulfide reductase NrfD n=1 Tax=Solicola gregarius TaxID=2908642 RepID=A0AA46TM28_9ACTN|nr:4Fe-4S dicluster domain-containing protein [Solicola gregarius]UYM07791.1 polysulfide reductase NrfD [Solicola gregarius]
MKYGFAIDQRTCVGCHACTVACKTEHDVPVGQFRTWVKYVDSGSYPDNTRDFGVMRCNHCTDAPCVKICPTEALFKRDDGIVDFDGDSCIGCKSCMQACPYDAIYIDEDTNTAAKCNFCAHRVDEGLEPACVVVCPTHSIWVGDLDDEDSGIARLIADNPTQVRAPEQNTGPNVFYLGADRAVLDPLEAPVRDTYLWAKPDEQRLRTQDDFTGSDPTATTTLNTAHPRPWGWRVATYLWTKAAGAGALFTAALALLFGVDLGVAGSVLAPVLAAAGAAATGVLLIWDLKRPERFYYLFTRPNNGSWLVRGGYCLLALGAAAIAWFVVRIADVGGLSEVIGVLAIVACAMAAGYTAFLFGQAEGRDLWQSKWLFPHLLVQAAMVGAGLMILASIVTGQDDAATAFAVRVMVVAVLGHVAISLADLLGRHETRGATVAAATLVRGRYARAFWGGSTALSLVALLIALPSWNGSLPGLALVAGLLVQVSLVVHEVVYVRAAQDVPLS